ncbi:hypothetical protein C4D60_Mb03t15190 [Musa balbisiana]|uniref:Uncharacterized protein n=1 Tax=Musa balbisiana TaxID=52838 RepID=A0A4S8JA50_MUSBA|nr:hypothetical protein C4D60_Mb03t15190 [Musa balbisiana]
MGSRRSSRDKGKRRLEEDFDPTLFDSKLHAQKFASMEFRNVHKGKVVPYLTAGARKVVFVVVLQDSNVLRPRSEQACRRTTAVPFFSELERSHLIH